MTELRATSPSLSLSFYLSSSLPHSVAAFQTLTVYLVVLDIKQQQEHEDAFNRQRQQRQHAAVRSATVVQT